MGISAAVVGGAVIGGVATSKGASKAAKASERAADKANTTQLAMYDQNREDLTPYREMGTGALQKLGKMYGVGPEGEAVDPDYSDFYESPDFKFAYDQGLRATNQSLAARGLSDSGPALKELTRYGQGAATQNLTNFKNTLASLAGIGQTATNTTGAMGTNTAANVGANQMRAGDARASAYQQKGQAIGNTVGTIGNTYALGQMGAFNTPAQNSSSMGASQAGYSPQYMNNWGG